MKQPGSALLHNVVLAVTQEIIVEAETLDAWSKAVLASQPRQKLSLLLDELKKRQMGSEAWWNQVPACLFGQIVQGSFNDELMPRSASACELHDVAQPQAGDHVVPQGIADFKHLPAELACSL